MIDLQRGIVGTNPAPHSGPDVVARAGFRRARASRGRRDGGVGASDAVAGRQGRPPSAHRCSGASSGQRPPDWAELMPELDRQPGDIVITKRQWGAFYGTELDLQLRRRGVDTILLCGITTNIGVETHGARRLRARLRPGVR